MERLDRGQSLNNRCHINGLAELPFGFVVKSHRNFCREPNRGQIDKHSVTDETQVDARNLPVENRIAGSVKRIRYMKIACKRVASAKRQYAQHCLAASK